MFNPQHAALIAPGGLGHSATVTSAPSTAASREGAPKKKISTACAGCKKRKTKCSGKYPCTQCIHRGTTEDCLIDSSTDLRRRGVSDRRFIELKEDRDLLELLFATIRASNDTQMNTLRDLISGNASKSDIARYVDQFLQTTAANTSHSTYSADSPPGTADLGHRPRGSIHDLLNPSP